MENLPDELLTKVLGRVKYSFEQYKTLGQVNQKFDAIVGSAAYRIEVARNQFPELTALLDLKTLTEQELERLAKRDWNAVKLVEKIALGNDDKSMKALLKNGVLILDYLCTDLWMSSAAKIVLIEWLKKDCIPKPHFILLRYTMNRTCDRVYKPSGPLSASWLDADHPGHRTELIAQMSVGDEDITMFRNRSFETDTLLRRPVNGLVEDLLDEIKDATVFDRDSMLITYGKLILAYEHATAIRGGRILFIFIVPGASIPIQHNDQEHDEHLAYLKTFRWRLLSDKDCHCEDNIPPKNDPHFEFHKCFGPESQHDQDFGAGLQHAAKVAAASWTRLKQWKVLGQSIRTGSERIRERTIPEHIKERVIDMVPEGTSIDDIWA